jgi:hypothetical protein
MAATGSQTDAPSPTAPAHLTIFPYTKRVDWPEYLAAWNDVRGSASGERVLATLNQSYAEVLRERCPKDRRTAEERSLWLAGHDARVQILQDLTTQAFYNTRLLQGKKTPRPQAPS